MSKIQKKPSALKREKTFLMFVGHICPPRYRSRDPIDSGFTKLVVTLDFNEVATGVQKSNQTKHFHRYHKIRLKLF